MKNLLLLCFLAGVGFAGWHYVQQNQAKNQTENLKASDTSQPAQPEVASASPSPSATVEPTRHLAPAGTVRLLAYHSVRTPRGFTGFAPGTSVEVVADKGATMLVRGEDLQFEVSKSEVTNDLDLADRVAGNDSQEQATLFARGQAESDAYGAANLKQMQATADSIQKAATAVPERPKVSVTTVSPHGHANLKGWATADRDGNFAVVGLGESVTAARNNALATIRTRLEGKPFTIVSEEGYDRTNGHPYRIVYAVQ